MELNFTEQLKIALGRRGMSAADLAEALGMSAQNLSQQMRRANFREQDMRKICDILGYDFRVEIMEKTV